MNEPVRTMAPRATVLLSTSGKRALTDPLLKIAHLQDMADLHRIESPNSPFIGGVLVKYPSGNTKALHWRSETPIHDTLAMGKELAARALQDRLDARQIDDAERTNWASFAAACTRHVSEWNAALRAALAKGAAARLEAGG